MAPSNDELPEPYDKDQIGAIEFVTVIAIILLSLSFLAVRVNFQRVHYDELENLHSAWLWQQGLRPYIDFFQNHSAVFFLPLRCVLAYRNDNDLLGAVRTGRGLSWLVVLLTIPATWLAALELLGSRRAAYLAAMAWAIFCALSDRTIQIRPDLLMWLLTLLGTYFVAHAVGLTREGPTQLDLGSAVVGGLLLGGRVLCCAKSPLLARAVACEHGYDASPIRLAPNQCLLAGRGRHRHGNGCCTCVCSCLAYGLQ